MLPDATRQAGKLEFVEERLGIEQHCHSEPVRFPGVGIPIEFRTIYRHPFVGDGFPVPRNSENCMGRDGKPVPYDAFTVGPTNSQFFKPAHCLSRHVIL